MGRKSGAQRKSKVPTLGGEERFSITPLVSVTGGIAVDVDESSFYFVDQAAPREKLGMGVFDGAVI